MEKDIIQVDSCIIGGSIAGLWTALELAKKAQRVLVVDKTYIGHEKSNVDVCLNYNCDPKMQEIALKAQKKWFAIKKQNNSDLITELRGSVSFSLDEETKENLEKTLEQQKQLDKEIGSFVIKDKQALKTLLKTKELGEQINAGLISVEDLALDNQNCLDYLRKELIKTGAKFWGSDEVISFELDEKNITGLVTKESIIKAENIIIAGGAKSSILLEDLGLKIPLRPARTHIIEYTSKLQMPTQIIHLKGKFGDYICKPMLNGRNHLIYTGLDDQMQATWSKKVNMQTVTSSMLEMVRVLPSLEYADIQETQTAQLAVTPDRLPYFGKTKHYKNLFINIGLHANNYLLAPYLAELMATLIDKGNKSDDVKTLNPDRFMEEKYKINYKNIAEQQAANITEKAITETSEKANIKTEKTSEKANIKTEKTSEKANIKTEKTSEE